MGQQILILSFIFKLFKILPWTPNAKIPEDIITHHCKQKLQFRKSIPKHFNLYYNIKNDNLEQFQSQMQEDFQLLKRQMCGFEWEE